MDKRVSDSYGKDSKATLKSKLRDPYVKAVRWASDRIKNAGIIALVTNNSFLDDISFDGMRKHLEDWFDIIYILDLGGNIKKNPKLSGTTHNVFGIKPGVSINLLIKKDNKIKERAIIFYSRTGEWWRKEEKYGLLEEKQSIVNIDWQRILPDEKFTWLTEGIQEDFEGLISIGTKYSKRSRRIEVNAIFKKFSPGVNTSRDTVIYDFAKNPLEMRIESFCKDYNSETLRYLQEENKREIDIDNFVSYDKIQWSDTLKNHLTRGIIVKCDRNKIRFSLYRPFTKKNIYTLIALAPQM